jgi:hypothetical protein
MPDEDGLTHGVAEQAAGGRVGGVAASRGVVAVPGEALGAGFGPVSAVGFALGERRGRGQVVDVDGDLIAECAQALGGLVDGPLVVAAVAGVRDVPAADLAGLPEGHDAAVDRLDSFGVQPPACLKQGALQAGVGDGNGDRFAWRDGVEVEGVDVCVSHERCSLRR